MGLVIGRLLSAQGLGFRVLGFRVLGFWGIFRGVRGFRVLGGLLSAETLQRMSV